ncbi:MAG TPA: dihydroorotate dehydrogenase-like protein [Candidatus Limnocylindria bacterium]|nr:dihydroorotate dehydrogenase-like protein [Candidatus Limnocylindria bacterium]
MIDLSTRYLGFTLPTPLVLSSSPLTEDLDTVRRGVDAGAGAVVLPSLFEEQFEIEGHDLDHHLTRHAHSHAEAVTYFPDPADYALGPDAYLEHVRRVKAAVHVPVVASLNGVSSGGWIEFARSLEQAGADALELNVYHLPSDPLRTGAEVEGRYLEVVRDVRRHVSIPLAVKLPHFFSAIGNVALELTRAGAQGLVLFNRFYQPDIDLERLEVVPNLTLSSPAELRLRLRWVAILFGRVPADLAVTGGVHAATDVLKAVMTGAACAMTASAVLQHGVEHLGTVLGELRRWMEEHEYQSIRQMQGSMSQQRVADPSAFERANYLKVLRSYAVQPRPPVIARP